MKVSTQKSSGTPGATAPPPPLLRCSARPQLCYIPNTLSEGPRLVTFTAPAPTNAEVTWGSVFCGCLVPLPPPH